jgi:hypothetical protein
VGGMGAGAGPGAGGTGMGTGAGGGSGGMIDRLPNKPLRSGPGPCPDGRCSGPGECCKSGDPEIPCGVNATFVCL